MREGKISKKKLNKMKVNINKDSTLRHIEREFQRRIKMLFEPVVVTRDTIVKSKSAPCEFLDVFKKVTDASDKNGGKKRTVLFIKWTLLCPLLQEKYYSNLTGPQGDLKEILEDFKEDIKWEWRCHNWLVYMHCFRNPKKNIVLL